MCAPLHSLHPNNPLSNREGTTGSPSATNLVQTKAKSARISHYTCFPSSLSPERTREKKRGFWGFHPLRQRSFKPTRGSHFAPHSHCSERCEEEWGGSARSQLLETSARVEKMRSFCYRLELKDWKCSETWLKFSPTEWNYWEPKLQRWCSTPVLWARGCVWTWSGKDTRCHGGSSQ